jgi:hypothetical protein
MIYSYHLAQVPTFIGLRSLWSAPVAGGLRFVEALAFMQLGAPIVSMKRMRVGHLALFAEWEDETALDGFLQNHLLGRRLANGWHVRMQYLRRYGMVKGLNHLPPKAGEWSEDEPVVAVTIARMKLRELPRFLAWGRPVETFVRNHPGQVFSMAAQRPPNTISTFSIWRSVRAMTAMVHGDAHTPASQVHREAMAEQRRRDFHHESTFMRFRPLSEQGQWQGRSLLPSTP